jgi:hypothetical protein
VMLYELLTGVMPYEGTGVEVALMNLKVATPPMSLREPGVSVDPLLEALTRMLMAKKADDRPATAKDVRVLLDLIAADREAAAIALGIVLPPEAPRLAQASTPPPIAETQAALPPPVAVQERPAPSTREMLAMTKGRSPWITRIGAAVLLLALTAGGVSLIGRHEASAAVDLDIASQAPAAAIEDRAIVTETAPPPVAPLEITAQPVPPALPIASPMPGRVVPAKPAPAVAIAGDTRSVVALYQTIARKLKAIADRRDMAADDLWQRFRLIRIQDALTSETKRAEVQAALLMIQRDIDDRFEKP